MPEMGTLVPEMGTRCGRGTGVPETRYGVPEIRRRAADLYADRRSLGGGDPYRQAESCNDVLSWQTGPSFS